MKHLHENSKNLDRLMSKLAEDVRRMIKFTSSRLTEGQLVQVCSKYLNQYAEDNSDKENINSNLPQKTAPIVPSPEVEYLKKQLRIQHDLSRKMFLQLNRDRLTLPEKMLDSRSVGADRLFLDIPLLSSTSSSDKVVDNIPLISSIRRENELTRSVPDKVSPHQNTQATNRSNRHFVSDVKVIEEENQ